MPRLATSKMSYAMARIFAMLLLSGSLALAMLSERLGGRERERERETENRETERQRERERERERDCFKA